MLRGCSAGHFSLLPLPPLFPFPLQPQSRDYFCRTRMPSPEKILFFSLLSCCVCFDCISSQDFESLPPFFGAIPSAADFSANKFFFFLYRLELVLFHLKQPCRALFGPPPSQSHHHPHCRSIPLLPLPFIVRARKPLNILISSNGLTGPRFTPPPGKPDLDQIS